jgi:hypothetical protein
MVRLSGGHAAIHCRINRYKNTEEDSNPESGTTKGSTSMCVDKGAMLYRIRSLFYRNHANAHHESQEVAWSTK